MTENKLKLCCCTAQNVGCTSLQVEAQADQEEEGGGFRTQRLNKNASQMKLAHSNICKTTNQSWAASQQSRKQCSETEPSSSTWTSADSSPRTQNLELCSQVERQSKTHTLHGCSIGKDFKHTPQVSSTAETETENTNQSIICWNCWAQRPKKADQSNGGSKMCPLSELDTPDVFNRMCTGKNYIHVGCKSKQ